MTYAALVGQTNIFIINKNMEILSKIKEKSEIKSTVFDENNVLFYTTFFHVKYALIESGLYGIIKSTEKPIYLMQVNNSTLYYNISNGNIESENINYYDVAFKLNLLNKNYDNIVKILQSGTVYGLKTVENIQKSGFPDLSLKFVSDPKQKFNLALKSGKLEEAKEAAEELKDKIYYDKLAEKAILMGKMDITEFCYVKSQNLDKLIFYYTLTGRQDKLKKVLAALKQTGDNSRRFLNAIYTNNVDEKIDILKETGHTNLAILLSKIHDKEEKEVEIMEEAEKNNKKILINNNDLNEIKSNMKIIIPLKPVVNVKNKEYYSNWSTITELKKQNKKEKKENI
jgi:coatomer protein complex subunit alpha (xenin)